MLSIVVVSIICYRFSVFKLSELTVCIFYNLYCKKQCNPLAGCLIKYEISKLAIIRHPRIKRFYAVIFRKHTFLFIMIHN